MHLCSQGWEDLHIEPMAGKVTLCWSDGKSTFGTRDVGEFPNVPEFVPKVEADIDIDTLIPAMYEAMGFAATEDTRPVLHAVSLILGDEIAVAAGDGYRMAHKTLPLSFPQESILVVPLGSVNALKLLWDKTPRTPPAALGKRPRPRAGQEGAGRRWRTRPHRTVEGPSVFVGELDA